MVAAKFVNFSLLCRLFGLCSGLFFCLYLTFGRGWFNRYSGDNLGFANSADDIAAAIAAFRAARPELPTQDRPGTQQSVQGVADDAHRQAPAAGRVRGQERAMGPGVASQQAVQRPDRGAQERLRDAERRRMEPVLERFDAAAEVRLLGPGTDLVFSLEGRHGAIDDGHLNVPGGEVFYCPVEESLEGEVTFGDVSELVQDVRLVFRGGEVVESSAGLGQELVRQALATDDGARRMGEFGIGCNDGISRPMRNVLFDEKMAGTIHLALGDGFPQLGGRNRSDLHWDLVLDMRRGGEIRCDGESVQRDGEWLL